MTTTRAFNPMLNNNRCLWSLKSKNFLSSICLRTVSTVSGHPVPGKVPPMKFSPGQLYPGILFQEKITSEEFPPEQLPPHNWPLWNPPQDNFSGGFCLPHCYPPGQLPLNSFTQDNYPPDYSPPKNFPQGNCALDFPWATNPGQQPPMKFFLEQVVTDFCPG